MLNVHTRNFGSMSILCLQGRIVIGSTAALRHAAHFPLGITTVVLDLAQVSSVDAAGLGVLLELRAQMQLKGIALKLMNLTKRISEVLEITRLNSVFEVTSAAELLSRYSHVSEVRMHQLASCA